MDLVEGGGLLQFASRRIKAQKPSLEVNIPGLPFLGNGLEPHIDIRGAGLPLRRYGIIG